MTATEQKWAERVEGWRESGLTSAQFSEGRGFSANGLRHWAYKLGKTKRRRPRPEVRIVRVVRATEEVPTRAEAPLTPAEPPVPTMAAAPAIAATSTTAQPPAPVAASLDIDVGGVRVVVRPGFDRVTLAALVDVLVARGET